MPWREGELDALYVTYSVEARRYAQGLVADESAVDELVDRVFIEIADASDVQAIRAAPWDLIRRRVTQLCLQGRGHPRSFPWLSDTPPIGREIEVLRRLVGGSAIWETPHASGLDAVDRALIGQVVAGIDTVDGLAEALGIWRRTARMRVRRLVRRLSLPDRAE